MQVNFTVDWLNFTCSNADNRTVYELAKTAIRPGHDESKALHGYELAIENAYGARVMWHTKRADMPPHVMYPGSVLNKYASDGTTARSIIQHHMLYNDTCKRIDLALDVLDSELNIKELSDMMEQGKAKTKFKTWTFLHGNNGDTLYLGSRQSEQFIRIYDKGAQLGTDDNWVRIEIELKGSRAVEFARYVATNTQDDYINRSRQLMLANISFPTELWAEIMGTVEVGISKAQNNEPDTAAWLLTQVAPAMARYIQKTGNERIVEQFMAIVHTMIDSAHQQDTAVGEVTK